MAASNWDTLMVNESGKYLAGEWIAPNGVKLEIYKSWVYMYVPIKKGTFRKKREYKYVSQIWEGNFTFRNIQIYAYRPPICTHLFEECSCEPNSIYILANYNDYEYKQPCAMMGIGTYAYEGDEFVGIRDWQVLKLHWLRRYAFDLSVEFFPMDLKDVDLSNPKRFNQGDAILIGAFGGTTKDVCTEVGKQDKETILGKALKGE